MRHLLAMARAAVVTAATAAVPVLVSTQASAAVECSVASTPASPSVATGAFGRDVVIEATARPVCRDDGNPVAIAVCVAARKELVSGSTSFAKGTKAIPYALTINNVAVGESDTQVFTGTLAYTGTDLPVSFFVRAEDYAGNPAGLYRATVTWAISHDPAICN